MRIFILSFALLVAFTSSAFALSQPEAKQIALEKFPGKAEISNHHVAGSTSIYEFEIEQADHSLVEVEIDAFTGSVVWTRVKRFAKDAPPPVPAITEEQAWPPALKYVNTQIAGKGVSERASYNGLAKVNGRLVHHLRVRRVSDNSANDYNVYVDAASGQVLEVRDND